MEEVSPACLQRKCYTNIHIVISASFSGSYINQGVPKKRAIMGVEANQFEEQREKKLVVLYDDIII